jgi:outer membrane protein TolC
LWQNRIVAAVKESKENLKAAQARLKEVENFSTYEVKNAFYKYQSSREIAGLYERDLLPQAELALRSSTAGYESGKIDLLNLIDSHRLYLNARIAYHQALAEQLRNFASLERTVGTSLAGGQGGGHEQ